MRTPPPFPEAFLIWRGSHAGRNIIGYFFTRRVTRPLSSQKWSGRKQWGNGSQSGSSDLKKVRTTMGGQKYINSHQCPTMYRPCLVHRKCVLHCCLSSSTSEPHLSWPLVLGTRLGWSIGSTPMDLDIQSHICVLYPGKLLWRCRIWTETSQWISDRFGNWFLLTWTKCLRAFERTFSISVKFLIVSRLPSAQLELIPANCLLTSHLGNKPIMAVSVYSKSARFANGAHGRGSGWGA